MSNTLTILRKIGRAMVLMMLVAAGTIALMRFAPGYFSDAREMDARYAAGARSELLAEQTQRGSLASLAALTVRQWSQGDLGESRQYHIPVTELVRPRVAATAWLLTRGILCGWLIALAAALPLSAVRHGTTLLSLPFTLLLAVPTGALATLCLLSNTGGPVLVLSLLLAARAFKFLRRLFSAGWSAPHLLIARAHGLRIHQLARVHLFPNLRPQLLALASLSLVTALSALVPIEVLFDFPGVGQLAWSAAMNRDLPVLMTITLLMAATVAFATMFSPPVRSPDLA